MAISGSFYISVHDDPSPAEIFLRIKSPDYIPETIALYGVIDRHLLVEYCSRDDLAHAPRVPAEILEDRAIDKGQAWAICFYIKTQGRKRGYVEKVDVGADTSTLEELVLLAQKQRAERQPKE